MNKHQDPAAKGTAGDVWRAFEAFKSANDERLKALETKGEDVLLAEKVARLDKHLSTLETKLERRGIADARAPLAGANSANPERKAAFSMYVRTGDAAPLARVEGKAASVGVGADGGFVATPEIEQMIERRLAVLSPMRAIASVRTFGGTSFKKPMSKGGAEVGWAAETAAREQSDTPTLDLVEFPSGELYALPAATQMLLDDSFVNIEEWLVGEVEDSFAAQESAAFVAGNGTNKPKGFAAYTNAAEGSQTWGQIGYLATGAAGGFAETSPADKLIDLIFAPKAQYRANGRFVMNRRTLAAVRKLKDGDGAYLWQPALAAGQDSSLLGYPVTELEDMPDIAANAFAIGFGDFARGYLIAERAGVTVLRDPYSAKPYVLFYVTKRVGGGVQDFDAIKLLKFGVS